MHITKVALEGYVPTNYTLNPFLWTKIPLNQTTGVHGIATVGRKGGGTGL